MSGARGVRIIGGRWRRTRIAVPALADLRPTPDRVRETLFNWLAPIIEGARCLDLFAGSGVLGFEALSRGAAGVTLVERDAAAVRALEALAARLAARGADVQHADVGAWLAREPRAFDVVFVDPPYASELRAATLAQLARGWLAPRALVYVEGPAGAAAPGAPWSVQRAGRTREVGFHLLELNP